MPTEFEAIQEALNKAMTLRAIWAGKMRDLEEAQNTRRVAVTAAERTFNDALRRAEQAYQRAEEKAKAEFAEAQREANELCEKAEAEVDEARRALEEHQNQVREEHGAVIDLMNTTPSGGRTRL